MSSCPKNDPFYIFNALGSAGRPTDQKMAEYGFTPFGLIGEIQFQGELATNPTRLPRKANLDWLLCVHEKSNGKNAKVMGIDLERWPVRDSASHARYLKVMQMAQALRPEGFSLGFFEILPNMRLQDFANSQGMPGTPERIEYDQLGVLRQPVADICDYIAPSLYTYWTDLNTWKAFSDMTIAKAIEMAKGKPVYPYLCPRYMPLADPSEAFVPVEMWREQMDYVWTECDGFILWDYYGRPMTEEDPWFVALRTFLDSLGGGI